MSHALAADRVNKIRAVHDRIAAWQDAWYASLFELSEEWEEFYRQADQVPDEPPVVVDQVHHVIFIAGLAAYRPLRRAKIAALVVSVLNEERLREPSRKHARLLKTFTLTQRVVGLHCQLYGKSPPKGLSQRTVERVIEELKQAPHPISKCVVSDHGPLGGYYLDTSRCVSRGEA